MFTMHAYALHESQRIHVIKSQHNNTIFKNKTAFIGLTQFNSLQLSARPHQKTKSVSNNVDGKIKYQTLIYTRLQKKPKKEIKLGQSECPSCYTTALDVYLEHKQNQTIKLQIATFCKWIVLVQQHWPWPYPFCFFHNFTKCYKSLTSQL